MKVNPLNQTLPSISPDLRDILREYDRIAAGLNGHPDGIEADFVMRVADYRLIREVLRELPVQIVNPPKGWTP